MFWTEITNLLSFTGVTDNSVWQDVFITSILIPLVLYFGNKLLNWWHGGKPASLLFQNYLKKNSEVFIFHSQMSGADDNWNFNPSQKYITRYPNPLASNSANLAIQKKLNIDPILSQAESECLADIYQIMGRVGKVNINIADLINDWNLWSAPIFTIGFNPKTITLMEKCEPIYFELYNGLLRLKNSELSFDSYSPNDAGIIQKTFIPGTDYPVFILAGLGTMGTTGAGFILKENFVDFGKLYANKPFCVFLKTKINEGRTAAVIKTLYPKPPLHRIIQYPFLFIKFNKKKYFKY